MITFLRSCLNWTLHISIWWITLRWAELWFHWKLRNLFAIRNSQFGIRNSEFRIQNLVLVLVPLFFSLLEYHRAAVHAVAEAGGAGAVVEDVS
jgi:hypothetical protein